MERVIDLLEKKNHYLKKFLLISEAELTNFQKGDFDNLEAFYDCREQILNIIGDIEDKFDVTFQQYSDVGQLSPMVKAQLTSFQKNKKEIVDQIMIRDLEIISCIESAKSEIIKELRLVKKGKKVIGSYRSEQEPTYQLNEEI